MEEKTRVRVLISGLVQGVFFRDSTKKLADKLGLRGWVRNTSQGEVEAVFEGEKKKIEEWLNWAKKGPPLARVEKLEIEWQEAKNEFESFEIRHD